MPRRDYHDDDDYPRPRRRRFRDEDDAPPPRRGKGEFPIWIPLSIAGGALALVVAVTLGYFLLRKSRPAAPAPQAIETSEPDIGGMAVAKKPAPAFNRLGLDKTLRLRANASPQQLLFGGDEGGHVGIASFAQGGYEVEVFKTDSGASKGKVRTKDSSNGHALSADGEWVAEVNSAPFYGNPVSVYRVADNNLANKFTPYPRMPQTLSKVPDLTWIGFLPGNKLLTINARGGYDVWSVPDFQKLHGKEGPLEAGQSMQRNGFTHTTTNFAITPDGKTLALFDGTGFTFINPITGDELGRTDPFTAARASFNSWGCALKSDGSRLAFLRTQGGGTTLTIWDVKSGKQLSEVQSQSDQRAGFCWWGSDHILIQQGGISSADIVSIATGQVVGNVHFSGIGKLGPTGPGDYLWGYTDGVLIRSTAGPMGARTNFSITPTGLQN
jgi:hypothetical protein